MARADAVYGVDIVWRILRFHAGCPALAMSVRHAFWPALLLTAFVLLRAFPFVWWSGTHFDSDQAVVGLMASHISEGRAFPLFFYGQNYMLAVEAYLAAPVMWLLGPTVTALKLPLVAINVAVVVLLLRILVRDARLAPWAALVAVLPVALPSAGVAARVTEANGGNVEPWLYILLFWIARKRPWWSGAILGVGVLHREFTAYGAAAMLVMDIASTAASANRRARVRPLAEHWAIVGLVFLAVRSAAASLQPFANALGPGTRGDDSQLLGAVVDTLGGRLCFDPAAWPSRAALVALDHWPRLMGGVPGPLRDYGVLTGVFSGRAGLGIWAVALTGMGLAAGVWHWVRSRRAVRAATPRLPAAGFAHVGTYLVLIGVISTLVYAFAICSQIRVETLRYNLLGIFLPVGALVMALQAWPQPAVRAGLAAAVALWCAINTSDVVALAREYSTHPPVDQRQLVADDLQRRGVAVAQSNFRNAYHLTFLARERVRVAATDFPRIRAYDLEARQQRAPVLAESPCEGGTALVKGLYLCPTR